MISKNTANYATAPVDDERKINTWSIEEAESFLELIKDSKLYLPAFIAFHTGLREGETCALRWVDIKEEYLEVNHNMVQKGRNLFPEDPKTAASKSKVYLSKELKDKLKEVKTHQNIMYLQSGKTINFDYVCSWDDGRPLRPLYVTKTFTKYVKKYNFKQITFHGLRHSHATILFSNGASSQEFLKGSGIAEYQLQMIFTFM